MRSHVNLKGFLFFINLGPDHTIKRYSNVNIIVGVGESTSNHPFVRESKIN